MLNKKQQDLMKLLEGHWIENPNKEFGAMLDDLLSKKLGLKKDLYYLTTDEMVVLLNVEKSEEFQFTDENLQKMRATRLRHYYENKEKYDEEPSPLFLGGKFNELNYCGGDDAILVFLNEVFASGYIDRDILLGEGDSLMHMTMECMYLYNDARDVNVFSLYFNGFSLVSGNTINRTIRFEVDCDGKKVCKALFNNEVMEEHQYRLLLNTILASGFDFESGSYLSE